MGTRLYSDQMEWNHEWKVPQKVKLDLVFSLTRVNRFLGFNSGISCPESLSALVEITRNPETYEKIAEYDTLLIERGVRVNYHHNTNKVLTLEGSYIAIDMSGIVVDEVERAGLDSDILYKNRTPAQVKKLAQILERVQKVCRKEARDYVRAHRIFCETLILNQSSLNVS